MKTGEFNHNQKYEMHGVSQVFELMDLLATSKTAHTLACLSDCLGMSNNKMFRLLATLEQRGIVEKFGQGWYRFGGKAFTLARRMLATESVLTHARPIMTDLVGLFNESVYLATYTNGVALLQGMVDCTLAIKSTSFVGNDLPCLQKSGRRPAPSDQSLQSTYPGLLIDRGSLDSELTTISAEFSDNIHSPAGALVVVAPTFRMTDGRIQSEIAAALFAGAQRLSALFGKGPEKGNEAFTASIRTGEIFTRETRAVAMH